MNKVTWYHCDTPPEYRMYGLVPYNLSPIQQGIQYGHAVVEYGQKYRDTAEYMKWATYDKTFIILNGGTTNLGFYNKDKVGTLNQHVQYLTELGIKTATFHEPDLGDQLTAVVFLVPDKVWDKDKYPDLQRQYWGGLGEDEYNSWVESVGGKQNAALREFLNKFRLA